MKRLTALALAGASLALTIGTAVPASANDLPTYSPVLIAEHPAPIAISTDDFSATQQIKTSYGVCNGVSKVRWFCLNQIKLRDEIAERYPEMAKAIIRINNDMATKSLKYWDRLNEDEENYGCVENKVVLLRADEHFISFRREVHFYCSGAHGTTECTYYNINPYGEFLGIEDVMHDGERDAIAKKIFDKVSEHADKEIAMANIHKMLTPRDDIEKQVGYTPTCLEFHFLPYGLGSYASGAPAVHVPFCEKHKNLFSEELVPDAFTPNKYVLAIQLGDTHIKHSLGLPLYPPQMNQLSGTWKLIKARVNDKSIPARELGLHSSITFQAKDDTPAQNVHIIRQQNIDEMENNSYKLNNVDDHLHSSVIVNSNSSKGWEYVFVDSHFVNVYKIKLIDIKHLLLTEYNGQKKGFTGVYQLL